MIKVLYWRVHIWAFLTVSATVMSWDPGDTTSTQSNVSKNYPFHKTLRLPEKISELSLCELIFWIDVKDADSIKSKKDNVPGTGEVRFIFRHPNLYNGQESFVVVVDDEETGRRKSRKKICFTNCENIHQQTIFIHGDTDIKNEKSVDVEAVAGNHECSDKTIMTSMTSDIGSMNRIHLTIFSILVLVLIMALIIIIITKMTIKKNRRRTGNGNDYTGLQKYREYCKYTYFIHAATFVLGVLVGGLSVYLPNIGNESSTVLPVVGITEAPPRIVKTETTSQIPTTSMLPVYIPNIGNCQCLDFAHCCSEKIEPDRTVCRNNTLRCLDSSFQDRRCDRPKSLLRITCPIEKCAASDYWCEERQNCINKNEVCDCGPGKAYCLLNTLLYPKYRCVDRAVVGTDKFDLTFCPDGSCAERCRGNYTITTVGCPKGEHQCGQVCKNKSEIVNFRTCEGECIESGEFCYFSQSKTKTAPSESSTGLIVAITVANVAIIVVVVVGSIQLIKKRKIQQIKRRKKEEKGLYDAVEENNEERVRSLLDHGVNPNTARPDRDGFYPLHVAAKQGNSIITSLLLDHGAEVDQHNNLKNTPLSIAAQWGKVDVARQLLQEGANVNNQMDTGWTPLHAAVTQNHKDMVLLLCEQNADLTLQATSRRVDQTGAKMNPLELARKQGFNEIGDILQASIQGGREVNSIQPSSQPLLAVQHITYKANVR